METVSKKTTITLFKTPSFGFLGAAFLIMLICKCGGWCPDLSWWIVTAPFWAPFAICAAFFVGFYALLMLVALIYAFVEILISILGAFIAAISYPFRKRKND